MRLIEGVAGEFLPVAPYLLKDIWVVAVCRSLLDEFRLHRVDYGLFLLTHSLTKSIALTTGETCKLTAQKHHLLLIDSDSVGILEVFLHARNIIFYRFQTILSADERRNIIHRTRPIEGVHSYKILKDSRFQFPKILLHSRRLKLERTNRSSFLIQFVCQIIVNRNIIEINFVARSLLDNLYGLLQLRQSFQSEEVHLDKSCRLNNVSVVLSDVTLHPREVRVVGGTHWHPVTYRVTADDESTGMNTRTTDCSLEHLGIFDGIALPGIHAHLSVLQCRCTLYGVGKVHLHTIGQPVGNGLTETVGNIERQTLHSRHVLYGVLCGHCRIGNDMCAVVPSILIHHPSQHFSTSVVIEVGINIRQIDTVRVEETLKQQVIFQWVDLRYSQAISHYGTGSRTTSRSHHHAELVAGSIDKVLNDKEVARESHCLHHVKLKVDVLFHVVRQRIAIPLLCSLIRKMAQIFGLKLDAVDLIPSSERLYFLHSLLFGKGILTILVGREFLQQFLLCIFFPYIFLSTKRFRNREERHDRPMIDAVELYFVEHFKRIRQCLRDIREHLVHLFPRLKPLLLRVSHAVRIVKVLSCGQTEQMVVGLGSLLILKMAVVGADEFYAIFLG